MARIILSLLVIYFLSCRNTPIADHTSSITFIEHSEIHADSLSDFALTMVADMDTVKQLSRYVDSASLHASSTYCMVDNIDTLSRNFLIGFYEQTNRDNGGFSHVLVRYNVPFSYGKPVIVNLY